MSPRSRQSPETVDGLRLVADDRRGVLYVRPDHHIGSYDTIEIDTFTLSYRRGQRPLSAQETERLGARLRAELERSVVEDGLEVVEAPDECTLAVQVHLVDLQLLDLDVSASARSSFVASAGSLLLIFEMRDGLSRQPLVRYGQRRKLPGGQVVGVPGSLSSRELSRTIGHLMEEVGGQMASVVPLTTRTRDVDCEGRLFKTTGRGLPVPR